MLMLLACLWLHVLQRNGRLESVQGISTRSEA
jgi:hypothetical protein